MRYVLVTGAIAEVIKRELVVGGRKSADGDTVLFVESGGWYVGIGNFSFYVGESEPKLKKGDRVKIVLELI